MPMFGADMRSFYVFDVFIGDSPEIRAQTWQAPFSKTTTCARCGGESRLAFVMKEQHSTGDIVATLHENGGKGDFWLHDRCAIAVYFCRDCLNPAVKYNQS
jgi:hypothetical protein